jgi:MFS family permease
VPSGLTLGERPSQNMHSAPAPPNHSPRVPFRERSEKDFGWSTVALLWGAFVLNYVDRQVVFSIYPILTRELHFSSAQLGLIASLFTLVYSLTMPISGWVADIVRRDRLIVISLLLWSSATWGTATAESVPAFLYWRAFMGVTESLFMPAALGIIAARHIGHTRSRALSVFATGQFVGITAGGVLGGWMGDHAAWRLGFSILAAAGICYALAFVLLNSVRSDHKVHTARLANPLNMLRSRTWLAICTAFLWYCAMLWVLLAWLPDFIHARYALSLTASGFSATAFVQAGSAVGVLAGGLLGDQFAKQFVQGRTYVAAFGLLGSAPFAWALLAVHSLNLLAFFSFAFGMLGGLFVANLYASAYDVIHENNYGAAAGAMNLVGGFAGSVAVLLTGTLKDHFGVSWIMSWIAGGAFVVAIGLMLVTKLCFHADRRRAVDFGEQPP